MVTNIPANIHKYQKHSTYSPCQREQCRERIQTGPGGLSYLTAAGTARALWLPNLRTVSSCCHPWRWWAAAAASWTWWPATQNRPSTFPLHDRAWRLILHRIEFQRFLLDKTGLQHFSNTKQGFTSSPAWDKASRFILHKTGLQAFSYTQNKTNIMWQECNAIQTSSQDYKTLCLWQLHSLHEKSSDLNEITQLHPQLDNNLA